MLADIALALAALPLLLAADNLRRYRTPEAAAARATVAVLIPARNEERNIEEAVACVLANRDVDVTLHVLDDSSTDRTPEILAAIADPRLRVAQAPPLPPGWSGKQHACATLASLTDAELMVFVDADVRLAPDALTRIAGYMERHPEMALASGFPRQITITWSEKLLLPLIHFLLLGYLPMAQMERSPSPGFGAGCGQLFVARRTPYRAAGGHAAIRASLHDGVTLPRAFRRSGFRTGLFDATTLASCRMYDNSASLWEGLTKNATEGMAKPLALPIWSALLAGGHVLPFLLAPAGSMAAIAACACSLGLRFALAARFRQSWLSAALHPIGVLALLIVQWAALIRAARGRPATWRGRAYPAQG